MSWFKIEVLLFLTLIVLFLYSWGRRDPNGRSAGQNVSAGTGGGKRHGTVVMATRRRYYVGCPDTTGGRGHTPLGGCPVPRVGRGRTDSPHWGHGSHSSLAICQLMATSVVTASTIHGNWATNVAMGIQNGKKCGLGGKGPFLFFSANPQQQTHRKLVQ